jgi:nucleoside permease NupC
MTERSLNIVTYALCGFSNIGSVGMTMSAMTAIAPSQTRKYSTVQHSTAQHSLADDTQRMRVQLLGLLTHSKPTSP